MQIKRYVVGDLQSNCYRITSDDEKSCILIDCGGELERIVGEAKKDGLNILAAVLTHAHYDHILGAASPQRDFTLYVHECDFKMLSSPTLNLSKYFGQPIRIDKNVKTFRGGDELKLGDIALKVMHTPGHTEGSCCFSVQNYLFSGDTLFYESYGRCDFPSGNEAKLAASLKALFALDTDYEILCGHGEKTTLFHEKRFNPLSYYD